MNGLLENTLLYVLMSPYSFLVILKLFRAGTPLFSPTSLQTSKTLLFMWVLATGIHQTRNEYKNFRMQEYASIHSAGRDSDDIIGHKTPGKLHGTLIRELE